MKDSKSSEYYITRCPYLWEVLPLAVLTEVTGKITSRKLFLIISAEPLMLEKLRHYDINDGHSLQKGRSPG